MDSSGWDNYDQKFIEENLGNRLPSKSKRNVLITSALPYINNVPHLGNIIGSGLSADVFARYCRSRDYQVLFVSGADEYGTATEMKALVDKVSPQELCDKYYKLHKDIYDQLEISFDHFGRTATSHQTEIAQSIFLKIMEKGFTSTSTLAQLHCSNCNKFLADRFVHGVCPHCKFIDARGDQCDDCGQLLDAVELIEPKCHICGCSPVIKESKHVFLDLDRLSSDLEKFLDSVIKAQNSRWSANAVAITKSWLKTGLNKRCITRDLKWGTPVPLAEFSSKVFYVWFDAPIGYLSITKELVGNDWELWWKDNGNIELFHFMGKDNVPFHSIIFPATQLASGEPFTMVKHVCATEYLNYEDKKFSKSRGVGVFGDAIATTGIPADIWRFYLIYMRPEGQDTSFCWDDFMLKVNTELLANFGNFASRALTFLNNSFNNTQPEVFLNSQDSELISAVNNDFTEFITLMEEVKLRDALRKVLAISRLGNQYMQSSEPWKLVKGSDEDKKRAQTVIGVASNLTFFLGVMLYPFMPTVSKRIREFCNISNVPCLPKHFVRFLKPGHRHNKAHSLITKLEATDIAKWKKLFDNTSDILTNHSEAKKSLSKKTPSKKKMSGESENNLTKNPNEFFEEIKQKFETAKSLFLAKQSKILDDEQTKLRGEVEHLKKALGYSDLFTPQKIVPNKPIATSSNGPVKTVQTEKSDESTTKEAHQKSTAVEPKKEATKKAVKKAEVTEDSEIDVGRLDFRIGRIIEAQKHPDADALYVEKIDLGEEKPRTVVSGLVRFVPLDEMQNRLVVCLCNLKPAKMRGVESQAMVMCASTPEKVEILTVDPQAKPGDKVFCPPFTHRPDVQLNPKKKIWESIAPDLSVNEHGECVYKGHKLHVSQADGTFLTAQTLRNVPVK